MEQTFCNWKCGIGLSPLSFTTCSQGRLKGSVAVDLWLVQLCDLHSPRDSRPAGPSPPELSAHRPPPACLSPHVTFFSPHRVPSAAASSLERQKPFTKHHSVWQTFWKTNVRSHLFIFQHLHKSISTVTVKHTHSSPVRTAAPSEQEWWPGLNESSCSLSK